MDHRAINELIELAKKDPYFFHSLVFEPEKAVKELKKKNLSGDEIILHTNPQAIMQRLITKTPLKKTGSNKISYFDCPQTCGESCTVSCGPTCCNSVNMQIAVMYAARFRDFT